MEMGGTENETFKARDEVIVSSPLAVVHYHLQEPVGPLHSMEHGNHGMPSASGLSFSDSSTGFTFGSSSLLGEALVSKATSTSTLDADFDHKLQHHSVLDDPPLPTMLPQYRPMIPHEKGMDTPLTDHVANIKGFRYSENGPPPLPPKSRDCSPIRSTAGSSSHGALLGNFVGGMMGHQSEFLDIIACPCCHMTQSNLIDPHQTTLSPVPSTALVQTSRGRSLLSAAADSDQEDDEQLQLEHDMKTGVLAEGVGYRISLVVVEGLLHKKGSGKDWLGSRGWKPRWTRLVVGRIEGYGDVSVPMLCVSWYPTSSSNSTVIVLDSTVVLAVDLPQKEDTQYRFEIQHASSNRTITSLPVTRTFSADSKKARDTWVLEISQALLSYEKEKAKAKRCQSIVSSNVHRSPSSLLPHASNTAAVGLLASGSFDDVWMGDRFTTGANIVAPQSTSPIRHIGGSTVSAPPLSPASTPMSSRQVRSTHTIGAAGTSVVSPSENRITTVRLPAKLAMRSSST